jgi:hypothetical protein
MIEEAVSSTYVAHDKEVKRINDLIEDWRMYAHSSIKRSISQRRFFYDSNYAKKQYQGLASGGGDFSAVYNIVRGSINMVKTDQRDLNPYLELYPASMNYQPRERVFAQSILNELQRDVIKESHGNIDDLVDLGFTACKFDIEHENDGTPKLVFERIVDPLSVYTDVSVDIHAPMSKRKFAGIIEEVKYYGNEETFNNHGIKKQDVPPSGRISIIYHFEREFVKSENHGIRFDAYEGNNITERVKRGVTYIRKFKKNIERVRVKKIICNKIVSDCIYPVNIIPIIMQASIAVDDLHMDLSSRLNLVPFADSCEDLQKVTNMSLSLYNKFMHRSRGSDKFMYPAEVVQGDGTEGNNFSKLYKNRNNNDNDLPFHPITDKDGNKQIVPPVPVPDIQISPVVTEALNMFPDAMRQILGAHMEPDITKNLSGEAIRRIQAIRYRSSKLYTDYFLAFMREVGEVMYHIFSEYYTFGMVIPTEVYGQTMPIPINKELPGGRKFMDISKLKDKFKFKVKIGASTATNRENTLLALDKLYSVTPPDLQPFIINSTIPLYASSLDTTNRDVIREAVVNGLQSFQQVQQQNQKAQQKAQQQQQAAIQQGMEEKHQDMAIKSEKNKAAMAESHSKVVNAITSEHRSQLESEIKKEELGIAKLRHMMELVTQKEESQRANVKAAAEIIKATRG